MKMKRGKRARALPGDFARGFVATGLLAALQDRRQRGRDDHRRTLRLALQGGAALAAGSAAAEALTSRRWATALAATAAGATAVLAIEQLLQEGNFEENADGQEEA